ncbi:holo-ACP synthase [Corynebacterium sp.]|uniref:holo-ACP synthase AcpS n=1 Tax=Corynebacterium sp. TaxID=1720 RepID=UPI0026DB60E3|nr:holo-ACP synthase [Corynebacterium sp.]MDO4610984.1 holo-ACP synthase [Corynebacterium sp.]
MHAVGVDLVHVPVFAEQLDVPGSGFARRVFAPGELLAAGRRGLAGDALARHLAGRWAVKEAVVKAWSQALYGEAPPIARDALDWAEIEIAADAWGREGVVLRGAARAAFDAGVGASVPGARFEVSVSHDGDYAIAVALLAD